MMIIIWHFAWLIGYDKLFRAEDGNQLEYDHSKNTELDLLEQYNDDADDDLFTFNAHEIYVTDPHDREDRDPFEQNQV